MISKITQQPVRVVASQWIVFKDLQCLISYDWSHIQVYIHTLTHSPPKVCEKDGL